MECGVYRNKGTQNVRVPLPRPHTFLLFTFELDFTVGSNSTTHSKLEATQLRRHSEQVGSLNHSLHVVCIHHTGADMKRHDYCTSAELEGWREVAAER